MWYDMLPPNIALHAALFYHALSMCGYGVVSMILQHPSNTNVYILILFHRCAAHFTHYHADGSNTDKGI